jgi:hypothetical protein
MRDESRVEWEQRQSAEVKAASRYLFDLISTKAPETGW